MLIKLRDIVLYSVLLKPEHWEGGQTDTKIYWWIWPSNSKQYKVHQKGIIFLKITYHQAISLMRFLKCWVSQWNLLNTWVKYTLYMCMGSNYPNEKKPILITLKDFNHRSPKICTLIYLWHFCNPEALNSFCNKIVKWRKVDKVSLSIPCWHRPAPLNPVFDKHSDQLWSFLFQPVTFLRTELGLEMSVIHQQCR